MTLQTKGGNLNPAALCLWFSVLLLLRLASVNRANARARFAVNAILFNYDILWISLFYAAHRAFAFASAASNAIISYNKSHDKYLLKINQLIKYTHNYIT